MNEEVLDEARYWLVDCGMSETHAFSLTSEQIARSIDRHYADGWDGFASTVGP